VVIPILTAYTLNLHTGPTTNVFVSIHGDDAGTGQASQPFHTLERARDEVRRIRASYPALDRPITVHVSPGFYTLEQPLTLTWIDSGTTQSPTIYDGKGAILSGGVSLNLKRAKLSTKSDSIQVPWTAELPSVASGDWRFSQLFVNGQRRFRPRYPKQGTFNISSEIQPSAEHKGQGESQFKFAPGAIASNWHNLNDVEVLTFHIWDMSRMRIGSVDSTTNVVTFTAPTGYDAGWANFSTGNRYLLENVPDALSDPGEWYLDNANGMLTYLPKPNETLAQSKVIAPRLDRIVDIEGKPDQGQFVDNVSFKGFTFAYTNWVLPKQGRFFPQAEIDLGAAIHALGWRKGRMDHCSITHIGEYAIELLNGCRDVTIDHCAMTDLGAGGVKIGQTNTMPDESDTAHDITVQNCEISAGGRVHPAAIGVWIGQSHHNTIAHNSIHDLYYTGISVGWTWGYGLSQAHHNRLIGNEIYDIGQKVLSDMGGIYTLGIEPGTTIDGNIIHDVDSYSYGGWGIYPDEGSSQELIQNNIVYRTKSGGFHQHYGRENVIRNNIFAFARDAEIIRTRAEDHLSFTFENNIVYWKDAPLLGSNWSGNNYRLDRNIYWRTDGKPIDFAGMSLDDWQKKGQDRHSVIADPLFMNPEQGDFRLKSNSPAWRLNFHPVDSKPRVRQKPSPANPAFPIPK